MVLWHMVSSRVLCTAWGAEGCRLQLLCNACVAEHYVKLHMPD